VERRSAHPTSQTRASSRTPPAVRAIPASRKAAVPAEEENWESF
jgi:hypothetical protein